MTLNSLLSMFFFSLIGVVRLMTMITKEIAAVYHEKLSVCPVHFKFTCPFLSVVRLCHWNPSISLVYFVISFNVFQLVFFFYAPMKMHNPNRVFVFLKTGTDLFEENSTLQFLTKWCGFTFVRWGSTFLHFVYWP